MSWLIKWKEDGHNFREKEYKTERGLLKKLDELNDDPLVIRIDIYKKVTYGEQLSLFDEKNLPF